MPVTVSVTVPVPAPGSVTVSAPVNVTVTVTAPVSRSSIVPPAPLFEPPTLRWYDGPDDRRMRIERGLEGDKLGD